MILTDFLQFNASGLYCAYGDFYLDPKEPVKQAVISHAHGDHAVPGNGNVYCTEATQRFMALRYQKNAGRAFYTAAFGQTFKIGSVAITFIPAGHVLGSAQVLMEYGGSRYLYTGDVKLQADTTCEPYEFAEADVLITETTFARPETSHPDVSTEITKLSAIKTNILLGAYGLGKAQRLISLINDLVPQKEILVHHRIMPLNRVYEDMGYRLGPCRLYERKLMKEQREYVYIVPPFTFDSYINAKGVTRLFASGWKNLQVSDRDSLYISDHADWNDILKVIEMTKPAEIWTLHGDGRHIAGYFKHKIVVKMLA